MQQASNIGAYRKYIDIKQLVSQNFSLLTDSSIETTVKQKKTLSLSSLVSKILFNFFDSGFDAGTLLLDTLLLLTSAIAVKTSALELLPLSSALVGQPIVTTEALTTPLLSLKYNNMF